MDVNYDHAIGAFTLLGLFSFPAYALYWLLSQLRAGARPRLWLAAAAFFAWGVATYVCFLRLVIGCLGGHCGGRVSPFLEFSILYAVSSAALILVLSRWRVRRAKPLGKH
jgi:hypothetical protein